MEPIDQADIKTRRMTDSDLSRILSLDWAEIPEKGMISLQKGGLLDSSFVAEVNNKLVGFVLARTVYVGRPMVGVCQLHLIAVRPDLQRRGIGSMLIDAIHEHCKKEGIHTIRALVNEDDTRLIGYFERLGFHPSKKINLDITWN